ncbi:hypothetical protein [Streptosporangium sp. CA-115845]|uniref:hypothetical protein n=1 Tax=Streptosporangium sp. CA-115845 TaxID=3240071 RepID=UPI003D8BE68B
MPEIPSEAVQACPCVCHGDHPGVEHVRACCPHWDGPLGWHVGESLPHIEARTRRKVAEEIRKLAKWEFSGGFVNLFAFQARHERLSHVETTHLSMAFRALADEIEGEALDAR